MKKWLCALSICTVAGLGTLGFAGCSGGEDVAAIRIKTLPETSFAVGDVVTPTLKDGVFTIEYSNGRTSDLPLSAADLVYVDYDDGTTGNRFIQENRAQVVVVRYKSKTTTYNVNVGKSDLRVQYEKSYSKVFDGESQQINDVLSIALPNGVSIAKIEYRLRGSSEPWGGAPLNAGVYDVRVTLSGGARYNDCVLDDISFTIRKANIDFAMEKSVQFNNIFMQYNDDVNAAANWKIGDANAGNIFTNALKSEYMSIAANVKYAYRASTSAEFVGLTGADGVFSLKNLEPGAYRLRAYCSGLENFEDFYYECDLDVAARALIYGQDYIISIENGAELIEYTPTTSLLDISTKIQVEDPTNLSVRLTFLNPAVKAKLVGIPVIYLNHSEPNTANWGGEGATKFQDFGDYKISISAIFVGGICYFDSTPLGINVYE